MPEQNKVAESALAVIPPLSKSDFPLRQQTVHSFRILKHTPMFLPSEITTQQSNSPLSFIASKSQLFEKKQNASPLISNFENLWQTSLNSMVIVR